MSSRRTLNRSWISFFFWCLVVNLGCQDLSPSNFLSDNQGTNQDCGVIYRVFSQQCNDLIAKTGTLLDALDHLGCHAAFKDFIGSHLSIKSLSEDGSNLPISTCCFEVTFQNNFTNNLWWPCHKNYSFTPIPIMDLNFILTLFAFAIGMHMYDF